MSESAFLPLPPGFERLRVASMSVRDNPIIELRDDDLAVECDDPYGSRPIWADYRKKGIPVYKATELRLKNHPYMAGAYRLVPPNAQRKVRVLKGPCIVSWAGQTMHSNHDVIITYQLPA